MGGFSVQLLKNIRLQMRTREAECLTGWQGARKRLYLLRGMPCPLCTQAASSGLISRRLGRPRKGEPLSVIPVLEWTGVSLVCPCGHGWSNPETLNAELRRFAYVEEDAEEA